jgi:predicted regulator of Ras-like GTPase activity (Roadblock/LC7/MglB family)
LDPNDYYDLLRKLFKTISEVQAAAIVTSEGFPIVSALPKGVDETVVSAMISALLSLSKRAVIDMQKGKFEEFCVEGDDGYLLILQVGPNEVLTISTSKKVKLGLLFLQAKRIFKDLYESEDYD